MFRKNCFLMVLSIMYLNLVNAQNFDLEEGKSFTSNGFEYAYTIKNEQLKTAKGEEYSRYEITLSVTNNSGCTKLYEEQNGIYSSEANVLAIFNCVNANGKRFTSKSSKIAARDFYINVKHKVNDKDITESVKAGFIFRSGETLRNNIIVLVPKGERPHMQCTVNNPIELMH